MIVAQGDVMTQYCADERGALAVWRYSCYLCALLCSASRFEGDCCGFIQGMHSVFGMWPQQNIQQRGSEDGTIGCTVAIICRDAKPDEAKLVVFVVPESSRLSRYAVCRST